jgi:hypothetical protein
MTGVKNVLIKSAAFKTEKERRKGVEKKSRKHKGKEGREENRLLCVLLQA